MMMSSQILNATRVEITRVGSGVFRNPVQALLRMGGCDDNARTIIASKIMDSVTFTGIAANFNRLVLENLHLSKKVLCICPICPIVMTWEGDQKTRFLAMNEQTMKGIQERTGEGEVVYIGLTEEPSAEGAHDMKWTQYYTLEAACKNGTGAWFEKVITITCAHWSVCPNGDDWYNAIASTSVGAFVDVLRAFSSAMCTIISLCSDRMKRIYMQNRLMQMNLKLNPRISSVLGATPKPTLCVLMLKRAPAHDR